LNLIEVEYKNNPGEDVDTIVKRRIGQSTFRSLLGAQSGMACHVSGLSKVNLLIASHIIPWSRSTGTEKTDPDNGLLLAINWDAVFDKGLICFDDQGKVIFSNDLDDDSIALLGLAKGASLPEKSMTSKRKGYLARHRNEIFEAWKRQ
jgi:predicted restriction endonuclease